MYEKMATECTKCGSNDLGIGKQNGYAALHPINKISLGSEVEYIICIKCGYIIDSYVKKPEKFKGILVSGKKIY